jgi:hypothetical protein
LTAQQEKERLTKEAKDARNQVALLSQLFKRQYRGDIQALLAGNVQVLGPHPSAGTPAPTIPGVLSPAFFLPQGAFGSQPPPLVLDESMYGPSILDNLSYPRVEDTYTVSPVKSFSPMEANTCSMEIRPDSDDHLVDVPESEGLDTFEDPTGLEATLRNSSLDGCKEVFLYRGSSDDDDEDGGQDRGEGG